MKQHYVVAFTQGSSGRFISNILWRMINNLNEEVLFTEVNSAHVESPWSDSLKYSTYYGDPNSPYVYTDLKFHNEVGILVTHTFPDYEELRNNFPHVKIILISISESDLNEIIYNSVTKNTHIKNLAAFKVWLYDVHLKKNEHDSYKYHDAIVPNDLLDRILLIKYNEIFRPVGESFVALEKLKLFSNTDIEPVVFESYKKYVNYRNTKWNQ